MGDRLELWLTDSQPASKSWVFMLALPQLEG
jgi:hypothetical protein